MTKRKRVRVKRPGPHPAVEGLPPTYVWDLARDGPPPRHWARMPSPRPCVRCAAVSNAHGARAIVCTGIHREKAYLMCRVCQHLFTLPVR